MIVAIFVALILLAVLGIATDYTQVWAHRQMAQGAADAACQAAAADLYFKYLYPTAPTGMSYGWIGSSFDCSSNTSSPPCSYAAANGYSGSAVTVSFPSSLPGVSPIPTSFTVANKYVQVAITDPVSMSFTRLVGASSTYNITAKAGCGVAAIPLPVPLVVLDPTDSGTLSGRGTPNITIYGGPNRSIQVNSSSSSAVDLKGNASIDLSNAGSGSGADFAVAGAESQPGGVTLGSAGKWLSPSLPSGDPFASSPEPTTNPATKGTAFPVAFTVNGCPDTSGCAEFTAGDFSSCSGSVSAGGNGCPVKPNFNSPYGADWFPAHPYTGGNLIVPQTKNSKNFMFSAQGLGGTSGASGSQPVWQNIAVANTVVDNGVTWKNMGPINTGPSTAIFDPGLYYIGANGMAFKQAIARVSTATGDGSHGVTFYFSSSSGTFTFGALSGSDSACGTVTASTNSWSPSGCLVKYAINGGPTTGTGWSLAFEPLACSGGPANNALIPATMDGNVLLGPCTGTYSGGNNNRGFLFFQGRSTTASPTLGANGSFIFSGFIYVHNRSSYGDTLTMGGGNSGSSFALGNVVTDQISLRGNSSLTMILNPSVLSPQLRPQLLE
jgi:hypothetical protein